MLRLSANRLSLSEARARVRGIIEAHAAAIPGFDREYWERSGFWFTESARFVRGREEASLTVDFWSEEHTAQDGGEETSVCVWTVGAQVSWSSTHRDPARARAAVVLYAQVVDLACAVEAQMAEHQVAETRAERDAAYAAEEAERLRGQVHAVDPLSATGAMACALSAEAIDRDGSLGGATAEWIPGDLGVVSCPRCRQVLKERQEREERLAKKAAAKAARDGLAARGGLKGGAL
jgi:hypothetical protein